MLTPPIRAVLFDLDGTLLRVEMHNFIPRYMKGFHACCNDLVGSGVLQRAMRAAIHLLLETECGQHSNEERFFSFLAGRLRLNEDLLRARFNQYLETGLEPLADEIFEIPETGPLLGCCRQAGIPMVLATNPVFPQVLNEARCRWAGIDSDDFEFVTCLENSRYCKPQGGYFTEVAEVLGLDPRECLMVGNDTSHDLSATEVGMTTWLVDSYMLEREGQAWEPDYRGSHQDLLEFFRIHLAS